MMIMRDTCMIVKKTMILVIIGMSLTASAYASTLSNALNDWDPGMLQGKIMEVGKDYIILQENRIVIMDTSIGGKNVETSITDGKGKAIDQRDLKRGTIVFAKGSHAIDDKTKGGVLVATEIYVVPRLLTPNDAKEYKGITEPAKPW
jgi:hypothetical protein